MASEQEVASTKDSDAGDDLRKALRNELSNFAGEVVGAEDRGEIIDLLKDVTEWLDRAV